MFDHSKTPVESVKENIPLLKIKLEKMLLPIYFELHNSKLEGNRIRKFSNFQKKVYEAINKYYNDQI